MNTRHGSPPRDAQGNRVRTAWSDPEHMRLTRQSPDELAASHECERLRGIDPDDPWATQPPVSGDDESDLRLWAAWVRAGHGNCKGWSWDSRDGVLVCECGERLSPVAEVVP